MRSEGFDLDFDLKLLIAIDTDEQIFKKRDEVQIILA